MAVKLLHSILGDSQSILCFPNNHEELIIVLSVYINICVGQYIPLIPNLLMQAP